MTYGVSNEAKENLKKSKLKKIEILSQFPIDKHDCVCQKLIGKIKFEVSRGMGAPSIIHCPHSTNGYKKYSIICANCKNKVGEVWATSLKMEDWFDLHYYTWHDDKRWYGGVGVNLSPIDGNVGFECACGNDTRDFRANQSLKGQPLVEKINSTMAGREWGKQYSKFKLKEI
jgi:hypothetical protein